MKLGKHSVEIKSLISEDVDMGTYGLIELELIEMEKLIQKKSLPLDELVKKLIDDYDRIEKDMKDTESSLKVATLYVLSALSNFRVKVKELQGKGVI